MPTQVSNRQRFKIDLRRRLIARRAVFMKEVQTLDALIAAGVTLDVGTALIALEDADGEAEHLKKCRKAAETMRTNPVETNMPVVDMLLTMLSLCLECGMSVNEDPTQWLADRLGITDDLVSVRIAGLEGDLEDDEEDD